METKEKKVPISEEKIFKVMFFVTVAIAAVFFIKNLLGKNMHAAIIIGASIACFAAVLGVVKLKCTNEKVKQGVLAVALLIFVFVIALNSGAYYSDDFIMFSAVIAMTGLYLEPKFTFAQILLADVCLIIMYMLHPEKAESFGQYIQCLGEFTVTGFLLRAVIVRGRQFIGISEDRTEEAEVLVGSMREMGVSLEKDFARSASDIDNNTRELQRGSDSIVQGADNMNLSCNDVQDRMLMSQQSIADLNKEVIQFELVLRENQTNMESMNKQLSAVSDTINEANQVFQAMEQKMGEVAHIADQLGSISYNTSILSLNASVEAARAGEKGAGFNVVASEMRKLSNDSNVFSDQVSEVVKGLMAEVGETAKQFEGSTKALEESRASMNELQDSFNRLTERFGSLYDNIGIQNDNIDQVNIIFEDLKARVLEMQVQSEGNQEAVKAIVDTMEMYRVNINRVIENTKR